MRPQSVSAPPSVAPNTTLPLWMYVTTSSKPCFSKQVLSAVILIRLLPPTLIPRNSATYRFMSIDCYHTCDHAHGAPDIPAGRTVRSRRVLFAGAGPAHPPLHDGRAGLPARVERRAHPRQRGAVR